MSKCYFRLETEMSVPERQRVFMSKLNRTAAEVAGIPVEQLPVHHITPGMDHADAFVYAVHTTHRMASNHFVVLVRGAAMQMGILDRIVPTTISDFPCPN